MAEQSNTVYYVEPLEIAISLEGSIVSSSINATPLVITLSLTGSISIGQMISASPLEIILSLLYTYVEVSPIKSNWIKWSKIGYLDFTIDESNVAGERPLDWKGQVYEILKLGKNTAVAYGENGITVLVPAGNTYGMQTIHRIGVKNWTAVVGSDDRHFFIDKTNKLLELSSEGLKLLDYSEYLEKLGNPKISFDIETGLLYICDGTRGYVYSSLSNSFGKGPANITGVGSQSNVLYVTANGEIVPEKFHICTDIYDLGTRKPKTIQYVEFGTDLTNDLEAMIECRVSNKDEFLKSKWFLVNPNGIAYIPCYGIEFKFHLRSFIYEYLELDYIKVNGVIHGFNMMENV